jgi:hypothetical protein
MVGTAAKLHVLQSVAMEIDAAIRNSSQDAVHVRLSSATAAC